MMETTIYNFHTSFYIKEIQKLAFNISHVQIFGANQCDDSYKTVFKRRKKFQDVICLRDYYERVVDIYAHKIQSEYSGVNIYVSIEGIKLEHFSALTKTRINASTK